MEVMRKDYKSDEDIFDELMKTPEAFVDFDRTWNGRYEFVRCGDCNRPTLGHWGEKCRHKEGGYDKKTVKNIWEKDEKLCNHKKYYEYFHGWKEEARDGL